MNPEAIVEIGNLAVAGLLNAIGLIQKLRAEGALTDEQLAAAADQQDANNDSGIRAILANLPAAPASGN